MQSLSNLPQFNQDPTVAHLNVTCWVFKYVVSTTRFSTKYGGNSRELQIDGYRDANWGSDTYRSNIYHWFWGSWWTAAQCLGKTSTSESIAEREPKYERSKKWRRSSEQPTLNIKHVFSDEQIADVPFQNSNIKQLRVLYGSIGSFPRPFPLRRHFLSISTINLIHHH